MGRVAESTARKCLISPRRAVNKGKIEKKVNGRHLLTETRKEKKRHVSSRVFQEDEVTSQR